MLSKLLDLFGVEAFNPQKHGEIAPADWHGVQARTRTPERSRDDFHLVASTDAGDTAYSTNFKNTAGTAHTYEAPVRPGGRGVGDNSRSPVLSHDDLKELAKRNVSQAAGEKIKPIWARNIGMTAAEIARASKVGLRTAQGAIGAFNAALAQKTAIAVTTN